MLRNPVAVFSVIALVAVIVAVDLVFFRQRFWFWERLMANVSIVLMFIAFYLRFTRHE